MAKQTTIKMAELDTIYNVIANDPDQKKYNRLAKQAAKMGTTVYWLLYAKLAERIGYGALKMDGDWYPVIGGQVNRRLGYQHNTAAAQIARFHGNITGGTKHITSL